VFGRCPSLLLAEACPENDQLFPDDIREQGRQYLETNGIEHEVKVYSGVPHGEPDLIMCLSLRWSTDLAAS
jgi:dienelactone hydrolase